LFAEILICVPVFLSRFVVDARRFRCFSTST
jgi:hypothetical protein